MEVSLLAALMSSLPGGSVFHHEYVCATSKRPSAKIKQDSLHLCFMGCGVELSDLIEQEFRGRPNSLISPQI